MTTMSRAIVRARPALLAAVLLLATATLAADPAEGTARDVLIRAATAKLGTDAVVEINPEEGPVVVATVDGGFLSVANDRVSILSEHALLANEINIEAARTELETARGLIGSDDEAERRIRRAEARIRAVEKVS